MLFRNDLDDFSFVNKYDQLGNELKSIDQKEETFNAEIEQERQKNEITLTRAQEDRLQKIKKFLDDEKKSSQQMYQDKYGEAVQHPTLLPKQKQYLQETLKEELQAAEDSMVRKYKQHSKLIADEIEFSRQTFLKVQQEKLKEQTNQIELQRAKLAIELQRLFAKSEYNQIESFKTELYKSIKEMDETIAKSVKLINSELTKDIIGEYKKIEDHLLNTTNLLAKRYLFYKRDELKTAITISLRKFFNYQLEDASSVANKVVMNLTDQVVLREINAISLHDILEQIQVDLFLKEFSHTTLDADVSVDFLEKDKNLNKKVSDAISGIKEECINYFKPVVDLFHALSDAKKREYGNALSSEISDKLIEQREALEALQIQAVNYLLKKINYRELLLSTRPGAGGELLNQLNIKIENAFADFVVNNNITPNVEEKLNEDYIRKYYLQLVVFHTQPQRIPSYSMRSKLTLTEVLFALETDFAKQNLVSDRQVVTTPAPAPQESPTPPTLTRDTAEEIKFYMNLFNKNQLPQFKYFLKIKNTPLASLKIISAELNGKSGAENYLNAIDAALKKFDVTGSNNGFFNQSATDTSSKKEEEKVLGLTK